MEAMLEKNTGFHMTKVGWIPIEWDVISLGSVTEIYDGTHTTPKYVESGVPFYSVEHISKNNFKHTKFISEEVFHKENERVKLEKGDILMTRIGDVGTAKLIDWDVRASFYVSLALIKQSSVFNPKFLELSFNGPILQKELYKRMIHVAFPVKINLGEIGKCLVCIPPKEEQTKIAQILSTWDQAILDTQNLIEQLKLRKKGLMQQLLTGKKRLKGFDGEWKEIRFDDVFTERIAYPIEKVPLYSLTIENGVTPKTERYERSFLVKNVENAYKKVCYKDFVLNPMNLRFGAIALFKENKVVSVSKYYNVFSASEYHSPYFLEYFLTSYEMICYYNAMSTGSLEEKKRVHFSDFKKFKKKLPLKDEQVAIAKILQLNDNEIANHENKLFQFEKEKKGLMQQLLTGQKRVKVD